MKPPGPTFAPGSQTRPDPPRPEAELSRRARYVWGGRLGSHVLRILGLSWSVRWDLPEAVRAIERAGERLVYAHWHQHLLPLAYTHRGRGIVVLVSAHGDGEYTAQVIHRLGFGTVRGSTTRGGRRAAVEMARLGRAGHPLGVTPDGPRGPRQVCQAGAVVIAQRAGLPLVPLAIGMRGGRRLRSWDRFEVPHLGARLLVTAGGPLYLPDDITPAAAIETWLPRLQAALDATEARAEAWERGEPNWEEVGRSRPDPGRTRANHAAGEAPGS